LYLKEYINNARSHERQIYFGNVILLKNKTQAFWDMTSSRLVY